MQERAAQAVMVAALEQVAAVERRAPTASVTPVQVAMALKATH
jgi:hypothetical protein